MSQQLGAALFVLCVVVAFGVPVMLPLALPVCLLGLTMWILGGRVERANERVSRATSKREAQGGCAEAMIYIVVALVVTGAFVLATAGGAGP